MSAIVRTTDSSQTLRHVRDVPTGDIQDRREQQRDSAVISFGHADQAEGLYEKISIFLPLPRRPLLKLRNRHTTASSRQWLSII